MQIFLHLLFCICGIAVVYFVIMFLYGIHLSAREAKDERLGVIIMTAIKAVHEQENKKLDKQKRTRNV